MFDVIRNILLGISLAVPIGPVNIEVIRRGLRFGFFPAFLVSIGAVLADTTYVLVIYFGFSNFLTTQLMKTLTWIFGSGVLLYLGYLSIKDYSAKIDLGKPSHKPQNSPLFTGYLITLFNPMTLAWWVSIYPFLQRTSDTSALISSLTIIFVVILWFFVLSIALHFGNRIGNNIINKKVMKCVNLIAGIFLLGFGVYFSYNALMSFVRISSVVYTFLIR